MKKIFCLQNNHTYRNMSCKKLRVLFFFWIRGSNWIFPRTPPSFWKLQQGTKVESYFCNSHQRKLQTRRKWSAFRKFVRSITWRNESHSLKRLIFFFGFWRFGMKLFTFFCPKLFLWKSRMQFWQSCQESSTQSQEISHSKIENV